MHYGFTGTRRGMARPQLAAVADLLASRLSGHSIGDDALKDWLHHGLCIGADEQMHKIARDLGLLIEGHPPTNQTMIAQGLVCDILRKPKPYFVRNHAIVDATVELFAAPWTKHEDGRSGTWSTVKYARSKRRMVTIIHPDGMIEFGP